MPKTEALSRGARVRVDSIVCNFDRDGFVWTSGFRFSEECNLGSGRLATQPSVAGGAELEQAGRNVDAVLSTHAAPWIDRDQDPHLDRRSEILLPTSSTGSLEMPRSWRVNMRSIGPAT